MVFIDKDYSPHGVICSNCDWCGYRINGVPDRCPVCNNELIWHGH
jgi:predicted Zn-ribbon and HTH transcriptional regulator